MNTQRNGKPEQELKIGQIWRSEPSESGNQWRILRINPDTGNVKVQRLSDNQTYTWHKSSILETGMELVPTSFRFPETYLNGCTKSRTLNEAIHDMKLTVAKNARDRLNRCKEEIKEIGQKHKENLNKKVEQVRKCYAAYETLVMAGFEPDWNVDWYHSYLRLDISKKDLPKLRRTLNVPLKASGRKELVEKSRRYVWVSMEAEGMPELILRYKDKLPEGEESKCRVEKIKHKAWTERRVVCETN